MSLLTKILSPGNILIDVDASSKKRVFEQIALMMENTQGIARSAVFDCLFSRERLGSTGLGHGVAIPHGRIKDLEEECGVFIRLSTPIPFDAPDGEPVDLLFALLVPEQASDIHLQLLSELAGKFNNPDFREALRAAPDIPSVYSLLTGENDHASDDRSATV